MSSFAVSRFSTVCTALGFILVAGTARAQFAECVVPSEVPGGVYETILDEASFDFGNVSEKTCNAIVKEGVKTCKAQVKAAAKCYDRALDANYKIILKQCAELETSGERAECKGVFKEDRDLGKAEVELSEQAGLASCVGEFESALLNECLDIFK
jgi:hypothetical protein